MRSRLRLGVLPGPRAEMIGKTPADPDGNIFDLFNYLIYLIYLFIYLDSLLAVYPIP